MNFQNFITRDLLKNLKKWCRQFGIFHYLYLPLIEIRVLKYICNIVGC